MPIDVPIKPQATNTWVPGYFMGVRMTEGDGIRLCFRLTDGGFADMFIKEGAIPRQICEDLHRACGLPLPDRTATTIKYPIVGDTDKLGFDKLIDIFIVQSRDGKYLNARSVRKFQGNASKHEDPFASHQASIPNDPFMKQPAQDDELPF